MKSTLSHLPEKNQFEINHIVEIIKEVLNPEMIILFGSYAKGKQVNHRYTSKGIIYEYISDYDFLVIVQKVAQQTSDKSWEIEEKAEVYEPPVNLEIHEAEFINKGLEIGQYFFTDIIKEGILLFDAGTTKFASPRMLSRDEQKEIALEDFHHWFNRGKEFLIDANNAAGRSSFKNAAFYLHQASENFYSALLLVFTGYKPKTHNLKKLRKKSKQFSEDLFVVFAVESNKQEEHLFELLKQGYIDARYSISYVITDEEVAQILVKINKMQGIIEQLCIDRVESL